jgi:protein-S-isoprenylcysteine O-methyltransferase Ste14
MSSAESQTMYWNMHYMLPLLAIVIGILYPVINLGTSMGRYRRPSQIRVIRLKRLAIIALPLSVAVAVLFPLPGLNTVGAAILLTTALLLPAIAIHFYMKMQSRKQRQQKEEH